MPITIISTARFNIPIGDVAVGGMSLNNRAPTRTMLTAVVGGTITSIVDDGAGKIKVGTSNAHGLTTGQLVCVSDDVGGTTEPIGGWTCTVVDATHITLDGSTFTHAYTSGGKLSYAAGAGLVIVGGGLIAIDNLYIGGFAAGILLDGAEHILIRNTMCVGPVDSLGGDINRCSVGVWIADGAWGCRGWTVPTSTNVVKIHDCNFSGCRIGVSR